MFFFLLKNEDHSDLKRLARENQIEIPWRSEIVEFLRNNGVEIQEVDLLSRERLRQMAKERGIPTGLSLSELRERLRQPIPAVKRQNTKPPVPTPRRKTTSRQSLMDEPVPEIQAKILIPKEIPLLPLRTKRLARLANQTVETFSGWLNWLKESGKQVAEKVNPKLKELKSIFGRKILL